MTIEIGHIYVKDLNNIEDILLPSINEYKKIEEKHNEKLLLIDNKEEFITQQEKQAIIQEIDKIFKKNDLHGIKYFFEKDFQEKADEIINKISIEKIKKEYFKKQKKHVYFYLVNNDKIPLYEEKEGNKTYYCQLLSLAWSVFKYELYKTRSILILPKIYQKVENQVNKIQKELYGFENIHYFH